MGTITAAAACRCWSAARDSIRALMRGFSDLPASDPDLRARLQHELERDGLAALHARLATLDPLAAQRIRASDTQRVRACARSRLR